MSDAQPENATPAPDPTPDPQFQAAQNEEEGLATDAVNQALLQHLQTRVVHLNAEVRRLSVELLTVQAERDRLQGREDE